MARFLLIEDDNTIRQLMVMTLTSAGHTVVEVATGDDCGSIFRRERPDVVITDIVMPEGGIESVLELRGEFPDIPFVVISGLAADSPTGIEIAQLLFPRRTLPKPFRLADLRTVAAEVLAEAKLV